MTARTDFHSLYSHDFLRIAACVPRAAVADPSFAVAETLRLASVGHADGTALMVFPELGLSSYAIDDLLLQDALQGAVEDALARSPRRRATSSR
ncbi:Glutamine-dependent NAD(+) synthetase [Methylobrevis pamukkalensis]|uniref:Glutamine-dependent NAD(+) synthetase n=1 Tax=Methylobrevis pamukkalensis TaxID=1439726 RepID=A0A1E3GZI9_9HYPH|nr:Glutamine-dependent NAD(+) synthetase [Methylobrevis pamukkalensis]